MIQVLRIGNHNRHKRSALKHLASKPRGKKPLGSQSHTMGVQYYNDIHKELDRVISG